MEDLGYEEYFYGNGITLIEWAEKIKKYLPEQLLLIKIKMSDEGNFMRKIVFQPIGRRYEKIVKELSNIENTGN